MKIEDSGMPQESYWNSLFDIEEIVNWLEPESVEGPVVEIGCGYGTFTIPVARRVKSSVIAFDIEQEMVERTELNVSRAGVANVHCSLRDVLESGTGLEAESASLVLLFNILHFDERRSLLKEASRILINGGIIAILHWRRDVQTPRGPAISLRPDEHSIDQAIARLELKVHAAGRILEPYHWGMQLIK